MLDLEAGIPEIPERRPDDHGGGPLPFWGPVVVVLLVILVACLLPDLNPKPGQPVPTVTTGLAETGPTTAAIDLTFWADVLVTSPTAKVCFQFKADARPTCRLAREWVR